MILSIAEYRQFDFITFPLGSEKKKPSLVGKLLKTLKDIKDYIFNSNEEKLNIQESISVFLGNCLQKLIFFGDSLEKLLNQENTTTDFGKFTLDSLPVDLIFLRIWKLRHDFERFCDRIQLTSKEEVIFNYYIFFSYYLIIS